jgi:hypothetical protein
MVNSVYYPILDYYGKRYLRENFLSVILVQEQNMMYLNYRESCGTFNSHFIMDHSEKLTRKVAKDYFTYLVNL